MNELNEIEEEMDMWTKEFVKHFIEKKVTTYIDVVKFNSNKEALIY